MTTIFGLIIAGKLPSKKVFENERILAIEDLHPVAPVHILILPKQAIANVGATGDEPLLGHLLTVATAIARQEGIDATGYRLVINKGRDAGESVPHLHLHMLGGRALEWPPG